VNSFEENDTKLLSSKENFDKITPQARLTRTVFQAFSQFESDLVVESTKESLQSARARGRKGRRPGVKQKDIDKAINLYDTEIHSLPEMEEMSDAS